PRRLGLAADVERLLRRRRGHQPVGPLVKGIERFDRPVDLPGTLSEAVDLAERPLPTGAAPRADLVRQRDVADGELGLGRVGLDHEWTVTWAEKRRSAAVQKIG